MEKESRGAVETPHGGRREVPSAHEGPQQGSETVDWEHNVVMWKHNQTDEILGGRENKQRVWS